MKRGVKIFLLLFVAANILVVWSHILTGLLSESVDSALVFGGIMLPLTALGLIWLLEQ